MAEAPPTAPNSDQTQREGLQRRGHPGRRGRFRGRGQHIDPPLKCQRSSHYVKHLDPPPSFRCFHIGLSFLVFNGPSYSE